MDLTALDNAIGDDTRGVIVVHPNNPTGSQLSHAEAHGIEALCAARDLMIISDEVFGDFTLDIEDRHDSLINNRSALTFVLMASEISIVNYLLAQSSDPTSAIAAMSIYNRIVLFAVNPMIAAAVALLPFSGKLIGEGDIGGIRRGLRQVSIASFVYIAVLVTPVMFLFGPVIAAALAESEVTAELAVFALRMVPLACLVTTPFFLCRPIFEAMGRGRPGLVMAIVRYLVLSIPLAWSGLHLAERAGHSGLTGLLIGMIAAAAITSFLFGAWTRSALRKRTATTS